MKWCIFTVLVLSTALAGCSKRVKAEEPEVVKVKPETPQKKLPAEGGQVEHGQVEVDENGQLPKGLGGLGPGAETGIPFIKSIVRKYNSLPMILMDLKKKVHLELLGQERLSEGEVAFSKGKLRMSISKPDKNLVVMDGHHIWVENHLPKNMGGKIQVSKFRSPKGASRKQAPLAFLLNTEDVWDEFKVTKSKIDGDFSYYEIVPKKPDSMPELVSLKIKAHIKDRWIRSLSFRDELENLTVLSFANHKVKKRVSKSTFKYKPPSGADVTVY